MVTDAIDTPILGYSWLCENDCCWVFGSTSIQICGKSIPLYEKPRSVVEVRRVYTREATHVPADYVVRVPVQLPACSLHTPNGDWLMSPKEIRPGLLLSRSFLSDTDPYSAVQLINVSGKNHLLPAGLSLGTVERGEYMGSLAGPTDFQSNDSVKFSPHAVDKTNDCLQADWQNACSECVVNVAKISREKTNFVNFCDKVDNVVSGRGQVISENSAAGVDLRPLPASGDVTKAADKTCSRGERLSDADNSCGGRPFDVARVTETRHPSPHSGRIGVLPSHDSEHKLNVAPLHVCGSARTFDKCFN